MKSASALLSTLAALTLSMTALPGCTQHATPGPQEARVQDINVHGIVPRANRESAGVTARQDIADLINRLPGTQNASVLLHQGNAYVGFIDIGPEPRANAIAPDGSQLTGNLSDAKKQQVIQLVQGQAPAVRKVFVTTSAQPVQKLSGYKHFILRGANFAPHVEEFHDFLTQTFDPTGTALPHSMAHNLQPGSHVNTTLRRTPGTTSTTPAGTAPGIGTPGPFGQTGVMGGPGTSGVPIRYGNMR